ncbi:MAG: hypothetical protein IPJ08_06280 [Burkholderiales bacterium]|nr:hypothetical protein [Burkholderiales bacterium]
MATAAAPIRLDRELAAAARDAAQTMSRSVAEQVSHWARLGRELERSPHVSVAQVQAVLRGDAPYDGLGVHEQAVVRTHWDESLAATLATLNLADAFAAEGHRYAELGKDGQIQVTAPAPAPAPKAAPKKKRAR